MMGRGRTFALLLVACWALAEEARAQGAEYAIKAEILDRIVRFVKWPTDAFPTAEAPFVWCVAGDDPFGGVLDKMIAERQYEGRRAELRHLSGLDGITACHLVFIAAGARPRLAEILAAVGALPILTAGDSPGFAEAGVLVNLYVEGGRVGFEIDLAAARRGRLELSGKLLHLARLVREPR